MPFIRCQFRPAKQTSIHRNLQYSPHKIEQIQHTFSLFNRNGIPNIRPYCVCSVNTINAITMAISLSIVFKRNEWGSCTKEQLIHIKSIYFFHVQYRFSFIFSAFRPLFSSIFLYILRWALVHWSISFLPFMAVKCNAHKRLMPFHYLFVWSILQI